MTPENSTKIPMKNDFSPLFGPAGQTTKNIIINLWFISDQRISQKTYKLVEEGWGSLRMASSGLIFRNKEAILLCGYPLIMKQRYRDLMFQLHGQSHELFIPQLKEWRTSREITPRPEALELLLPWRIAFYGSACEAIKKFLVRLKM